MKSLILSIVGCVFVSLCVITDYAESQQKYWIHFKDKGPLTAEILKQPSAANIGLNQTALIRRANTFGIRYYPDVTADEILRKTTTRILPSFPETERTFAPPLIDEQDLPVFSEYIDHILLTKVQIRATSKWMNAVSIECNEQQLREILAFPFIAYAQPVRVWKRRDDPILDEMPPFLKPVFTAAHDINYGDSFQQLSVINVPKVHDIWIDGTGITVGMLDVGYRWREHEAMKNTRVLGEYDFINKDTLTENEPNETYGQDSHGTVTFSAIAGFFEGKLVGPAFNASYLLAKTEVVDSETQIEEDYWVQGLEWLESKGAAIVSSSLAYSTWDDSTGYRYENGDFDGKTAVTTRAASRAALLGVTVVTAMGNEGNTPGTLMAPADADSIISVGAITIENKIAGFSSNGPTNDGRTKPDVVAPGVQVFCATKSGNDTYTRASGTSLATPLTAGVAALVRSVRPELDALQVRNTLRATADNPDSPNNKYGWGKIDAWEALLYNGMVISTNPKVSWDGKKNIAAVYVVSPYPIDSREVKITYTVDGGSDVPGAMTRISSYPGMPEGSGLYIYSFPELPKDVLVRYYVNAADIRENRVSPYGAPVSRHEFRVGETRLKGARDFLPHSYKLEQIYPNPLSQSSIALIRYEVPMPGGNVSIEVYDILGRRIQTLVDRYHEVGTYSTQFNTIGLATGAYIYALRGGNDRIVRRMMIIK